MFVWTSSEALLTAIVITTFFYDNFLFYPKTNVSISYNQAYYKCIFQNDVKLYKI